MLRGNRNRIRLVIIAAFGILFSCAIFTGKHGRGDEAIVGTWQSVLEPRVELRFFPDERMEVRNHFRGTHRFGTWERQEGDIYVDSNGQFWGPLDPSKPKDLYMIQNFQLIHTDGIAYSYRTIKGGQQRWYTTEVRIFEDKAYFSDYDAWMEMSRGKTNPFVRTLQNVSTSVANVFNVSG